MTDEQVTKLIQEKPLRALVMGLLAQRDHYINAYSSTIGDEEMAARLIESCDNSMNEDASGT